MEVSKIDERTIAVTKQVVDAFTMDELSLKRWTLNDIKEKEIKACQETWEGLVKQRDALELVRTQNIAKLDEQIAEIDTLIAEAEKLGVKE